MHLKPFEVIVIGSGATGGIAALTLAKAGIRVLVIEAGPQLSLKQAFGSEPQNTFKRLYGLISGEHRKQSQHPGFWKTNPLLYANEKENIYEHPKDRPFIWTQGRQVGGKSLTWGGITLRLSDYDFKAANHDGVGESWPIQYSDLSSHYSNIENLLRIYGNKDGLDQLPDGEYVGKKPFTKSEKVFAGRTINKLGYPVIHSRGFESNNSKTNKDWPRSSSLGSTLKIAIATGKVQLLSNHIAERLIMNGSEDKAKGIIVINKENSSRIKLEAKLIVLCASTIQTLKFLLNSEKAHNEEGFEDTSQSLGCNLMDHVSICRFFNLSGQGIDPLENSGETLSGAGSFFIPFGNKPNIYEHKGFNRGYGIWGGIDRFEPPSFLKYDKYSKIGFLIGHGEVLPNKSNKVTLSNKKDIWGGYIPNIDIKWRENENNMVDHMSKTIEKIIVSSGGKMLPLNKIINFPFSNLILNNALATQQNAPPPGYYIHEVGGAPMGSSEDKSVVDKWNRLWRCKNVLVVDGACWPSSSWQSPTLTMMAITRRACLKATKN
ncbi:GMC family oxidoreductase [Prochlorococcus sp. MIT 1223]|uniref:GMC family oxidoreductase n=1 Tax=Prochlorococcus sp. MIT 1223 TaxID=3096217 RepID=UPI002A766592|nr:GMC family oxidoreductase [Prochlorococcus sp. MIT 1223]